MANAHDDPWTLYWQADNVDSCLPAHSGNDSTTIDRFWHEFAAQLPVGAAVLDLATGNGAVPRRLLAKNGSLKITAVDKADIAPGDYLSDATDLQPVEFRGGVDMEELPFEAASFDAVTSQFGLEYARLVTAAGVAADVLRPGGAMRLLLHHAHSDVVEPARAALDEMARLLVAGGVIDELGRYIRGETSEAALESVGEKHMRDTAAKTRHLTGQVFTGVNRVITDLPRDAGRARALAVSLTMRLLAEQARMTQLCAAALDDAGADSLRDALQRKGLVVDRLTPLTSEDASAGTALVGWQLHAHRPLHT